MTKLIKFLVGACVACCVAMLWICIDMKRHNTKIDEMNDALNERDSVYRAQQRKMITTEENAD